MNMKFIHNERKIKRADKILEKAAKNVNGGYVLLFHSLNTKTSYISGGGKKLCQAVALLSALDEETFMEVLNAAMKVKDTNKDAKKEEK